LTSTKFNVRIHSKIYLNEVFYDSKCCYFNNPVFWDSRRLTYYPKVLLLGDSDGEAIAKDGLRKDNKNLIFLVAMITFASCGADNIGVFVPYFTTLNLANLIVTLLTFLVMIYLLVFSAQKLAQVPSVGETLEKYSRWFIAVVYLGLGMYILIENNSFDMLWAVLG